MRRRRQSVFWTVVVFWVTLAILSAAWLYTTWQSSRAVLPPGLAINGIPMGGMLREQALSAIELAYTVPVSVSYAGQVLPTILPEIIELRVDIEATAENLDEAIAETEGARAFLDYLAAQMKRREVEPIEVNAVVLYSRERVDAYLERTAQRYDHAPMPPVALPEQGAFRPAVDGTELDMEASVPLLIAAILAADATERQVDLVVTREPAPEADTTILRDAILTSIADAAAGVGVFAKDLGSDRELCINCQTSFSGASTLMLGIALTSYSHEEWPLDADLAAGINDMLTENDHNAANLLLGEISAGDPYSGSEQVTELLGSLGLGRSFIFAPYGQEQGEGRQPPEGPTGVEGEPTTNPNPAMQTTPLEAGLLLEGVHQCRHGGGSIRAIYPQAITPAECEDILLRLQRNTGDPLLGASMPQTAGIAHQPGWQASTYVDAALVMGPVTDFILVVFAYQPAWLESDQAAPTFARIGELTYRFFNGMQ